MSDSARELESRAMRLPARARARLAELLISSLDPQTDPDVEAQWLEESEHRLAELETGEASSQPAERVFEEARSKLRQERRASRA